VGFLVDKVALKQGFLVVLLSISFHRGSPYSYIIYGIKKKLVGGRSSET
jgi:hypothetical protein